MAELGTAAWTGCLRFPSSTAIPWMELITQGEPSDPDWSALTVGSKTGLCPHQRSGDLDIDIVRKRFQMSIFPTPQFSE